MATLVNICGASHSGTTALDLMIGSGTSAFSCGEVYALFRPWRRDHFAIRCPCGASPCPVWERIAPGPPSSFHARVVEALGADFVVDSSKSPSWVLDTQRWAPRSDLRVCNLVIWKHPERFAFSYWKRGWGLRGARDQWVRMYRRYLDAGLTLASVSHAALRRDPASELRRVCRWIGQDYREGQERFWEHAHHHLFGSAGTRRQVQRRAVDPHADPEAPEDFHRDLARKGVDFSGDLEVAELLRRLAACDVSTLPGGPAGDSRAGGVRVRWRARPLWYHAARWRRRYKRLFPDPWPEDEDAPMGEMGSTCRG
jgi:hypothetical protein